MDDRKKKISELEKELEKTKEERKDREKQAHLEKEIKGEKKKIIEAEYSSQIGVAKTLMKGTKVVSKGVWNVLKRGADNYGKNLEKQEVEKKKKKNKNDYSEEHPFQDPPFKF